MVKRNKKDFNHNLMIVGVVGVVAVIGILITLGSGTYTGKASGIKTERQAFYGLYSECVDMYGERSGNSNNAALMDQIKDWCSCRVYGGYLEKEPTPDTEINWAELERQQAGRRGECGENPITGMATGKPYRQLKNTKDFVECLHRSGMVKEINKYGKLVPWDLYTKDTGKAIFTDVPLETIKWCACRFGYGLDPYEAVIKNIHNWNAEAIVKDPLNFFGEVENNAKMPECGDYPNPIK